MNGFIYIIRNTINNKVYIGQTRVDVITRWKEHLRHAKYGKQIINRAMRKYGVNNFYISTLEICDSKLLDIREMYYISLYNSTNKSKGYNVSIGGNTPRFKRKVLNIETLINLYVKEKWSLAQIANKFNVSVYIIKTELRNAGIIIRDRHDYISKKKKIKKDNILEAINNTKSLRSAAKYLSIPYSTFRAACIYNNIEYNSSKSAQH